MAGEALTSKFMLGTATLMLGPVADLDILNPTTHSVGLAKNVTMKTTPGFTELTQGVKNNVVFSVQTSNKVMVSAEVYEYTSKNLAYSVGLDGSTFVASTVESTVLTPMSLTLGITGTSLVLAASGGTSFTAGDDITIQVGTSDQIYARKIVSKSTDTLTLNLGVPVAVPAGAVVKKVNVISVGSKVDQPFLAAKIVGTIADGSEIIILIPKVRITSGASLAFKTDGYDNVPMELTVYDLVATDPQYANFLAYGNAKMITAD